MKLTARLFFALVMTATLLIACRDGSPGATTASSPAASGASVGTQSKPTLTGRPWALTAVTSKTPAFEAVLPADQRLNDTITFNTDGTYSGTAGCSPIAGTHKVTGSSLTISAGASTVGFCPDSDFGSIFARSLTRAATYAATIDTLTITLIDGGTLTLEGLETAPPSAEPSSLASLAPGASPPAELLGTTWKLTEITERTPAFQGAVPEADQSNYTIEFQKGRTFNVRADCNQIRGTYEVHRGDGRTDLGLEPGGGSISIQLGPSTLAACPRGSMGDLYLLGLGKASSFVLEDGLLTLTLNDGDGAKLVFGT